MIHNIKIYKHFADDILYRQKTFEIRFNDRNYQLGDYLIFQCIDESTKEPIRHTINFQRYRIIYVLSGHGLADGYLALGIERV